ncbi:hypothetical protein OESDEN_06065 [Oesophagostomum dentatum]|uniref:Uncharacterized protein n=1 Tax=Oesophagostomum dentatum TaxID=61180 RepID=A0A0B1T9U4_OESDE|nr:hypothetical protein OESDEN_06065 [Oesophagostomum dentatum]
MPAHPMRMKFMLHDMATEGGWSFQRCRFACIYAAQGTTGHVPSFALWQASTDETHFHRYIVGSSLQQVRFKGRRQ